MPTSPKSLFKIISFDVVHDTTSCGLVLALNVGSRCSYYVGNLYMQIKVVQSVLSNLAESKVNHLTCKLR